MEGRPPRLRLAVWAVGPWGERGWKAGQAVGQRAPRGPSPGPRSLGGWAAASSKFLQRPRPRRGSFPTAPRRGVGAPAGCSRAGGSALKMGSVAFKFVLKNVVSRRSVLQEGGHDEAGWKKRLLGGLCEEKNRWRTPPGEVQLLYVLLSQRYEFYTQNWKSSAQGSYAWKAFLTRKWIFVFSVPPSFLPWDAQPL